MNISPASHTLPTAFKWSVFLLTSILTTSCAIQSESNLPNAPLPQQTVSTAAIAANTRNTNAVKCKSPEDIDKSKLTSEREDSKLYRAVLRKDIKTVEKLLQQNADVEEKDDYQSTVLLYAVSPIVGEISLSPPGVAPSAAEREKRQREAQQDEQAQIEITRELLTYGANPNQKNIYGETPLMRAAGLGYPTDHVIKLLTMLVERRADVNTQDVRGFTALMEAARNGKPEVIKFLLENGADAKLTNCDDETALSIAQKYKNEEVINILQNAG